MSDSLIEQVKRLAEAKAHYARTGSSLRFDELARDKLDFPALLAHMQAQQAVVDAARRATEAFQSVRDTPLEICQCSEDVHDKLMALAAALAAKGSQ